MSIDVAQRIAEVARLIELRAYTPAAIESLQLLEFALREVITRNLTKIPGEDRLRFNDVEREVGSGKRGFDTFTLGQLVGLIHGSRFLEVWSRATGTDVASLGMINLDALNDLRIRVVHQHREAAPAEAYLLLNVLQNMVDIFGIVQAEQTPKWRRVDQRRQAQPRAGRVEGERKERRDPAGAVAKRGLSIGTAKDVISWGWDGSTLLEELIKLDYATIDGLNDVNEGRVDQWAPVFLDHPDTWRLLVAAPGQIVGYWHFVPLFDADFELARRGALNDSDITTDRVCYLELPGHYGIYFVSMSILGPYRGVASFRMLMDALINQMVELARHGVYFREICANAFTSQGEALCKTLEMDFVCKHEDYGRVFTRSMLPVPNRGIFQSSPALIELYSAANITTD